MYSNMKDSLTHIQNGMLGNVQSFSQYSIQNNVPSIQESNSFINQPFLSNLPYDPYRGRGFNNVNKP